MNFSFCDLVSVQKMKISIPHGHPKSINLLPECRAKTQIQFNQALTKHKKLVVAFTWEKKYIMDKITKYDNFVDFKSLLSVA